VPIRNASTIIPRGTIRLFAVSAVTPGARWVCVLYQRRRVAGTPYRAIIWPVPVHRKSKIAWGMPCTKLGKHSLERAVVTEVALAHEAYKANPRRDGHRASAFLSRTKHSHRSVIA
jgi:hypothetical protein